MQDVEVPRMVSVPTNLSTSPHTFLLSSSTSGTHSWMYLAPVTHSARLAVPLEKVLKKVRTEMTETVKLTEVYNKISIFLCAILFSKPSSQGAGPSDF